jgi:hypothetical protein
MFNPSDLDQQQVFGYIFISDKMKQSFQENEDESHSVGLSWVQPGSLQPFSKPTS